MLHIIPILLVFYTGLSMYAYTPALPYLASEFDTSDFALKLSISFFILFYGLFKSFWLSLSAALSDKIILVIAILLAIFGTATTMLSNTVTIFIIGRILEGIGLSGTLIIIRCSLHKNNELLSYSKFTANVTLFIFLGCLIGPIFGAYIFKDFGWRYIFGILLVLSLIMNVFIAIFYLGAKTEHILTTSFRKISVDFYRLFFRRQLMGFLFPCIFAFTGCFSYFAISPYLFVSYLDYSVTSYAYLNIPVVAAFVVGDIFQRIFIKRFSHYKMIVIALCFMVLSAITLLAFMGINQHMTLAALLPMSLFLFASGIICPCSLAKVRSEADPYKIEAAAFAPYLIYVISGIGIYTLSSLNLFSPISPNIFFATLCVLSVLFFFIFARPGSNTNNQTNLNVDPQNKS